jgi:hypothetical protein
MVVLTIILGVIRTEYVVNWVSGNQAAAKVILLPVNVIYVCFFSYIIARHAISNNFNINLLSLGAIMACSAVTLEFIIGYFAERKTILELLKDYNILAGNTWVLVLMMILFFPKICYWYINYRMK